jgi:hypothetical protein
MILLPSGKKMLVWFDDWKTNGYADWRQWSSILCQQWRIQCNMPGARLIDVLVERRGDFALICDLRPVRMPVSLYGCRVSDTALIPIAQTIPDLQQYITDFHSCAVTTRK